MRKWLKEAREKKGLTMKSVAVAAGISECYYCQIESGKRNAAPNVAKKIASVLGISWVKFFEESTETEVLT